MHALAMSSRGSVPYVEIEFPCDDNRPMGLSSGWWWGGCASALVVAAAFALRPSPPDAARAAAPAATGLPWQVEVLADGTSRVMGLPLGAATLAQVRELAGDRLQLALVAALGEVGQLEALVEPFDAGFISGRLVLAFDVPPATLRRWRDGAVGSSPMEGGLRRFSLRTADLSEADGVPLASLSFVPVARLSEADVRQRFGPPETERALAGGATQMSYPKLGVSAAVAAGQRGVIEYVAPREAARLSAAASAPMPPVPR